MEGVTPEFEKLISEGVLFSNFYASSDRSDRGITAVLSGYPAQPTRSIIKTPAKACKLPTLASSLDKAGYSTSFYYGGELDFANIRSYLVNSGFDKMVGKDDFEEKDCNSKWGAHDHVVFDKFLLDTDEKYAKGSISPFFSTIFTLSSHEPFEVPMETKMEGNDDASRFLNAMYYADQSVGEFIRQAKTGGWYENSLIIHVADHGHPLPGNSPVHAPEKFHIPMLWLGGALNEKDTVITTIGSQTDLAATLLRQMDISSESFTWSKDMLDPGTLPFAQDVFNNGMGHINQQGLVTFDNVGKIIIHQDTATTEAGLHAAKAHLQVSYQDFLNK